MSFIIAFSAITLMHVVFGELAPKSLALQFPETVAMLVTTPTRVFLIIFRPIISVMNGLGRGFLRLVGVKPAASEHSLVYREEELCLIVTPSRQWQTGGDRGSDYPPAFTFYDYTAKVMVPRTELVPLPADASLERARTIISTFRFSRFPVYGRNLDDILGLLYLKDLPVLTAWPAAQPFDLRTLIRPVLTVPTTVPIDELLNLMKQRRTHVAIAVDEYGGTAGMSTLDDIVERVVGDVPDKFEQSPPDIVPMTDGSASVNGLTPLGDVNAWFDLTLPVDESHTIGGYIFSLLGRRPKVGDTVDIGPVSGSGSRCSMACESPRSALFRCRPDPATNGRANCQGIPSPYRLATDSLELLVSVSRSGAFAGRLMAAPMGSACLPATATARRQQ